MNNGHKISEILELKNPVYQVFLWHYYQKDTFFVKSRRGDFLKKYCKIISCSFACHVTKNENYQKSYEIRM
jgi:hypothetical protein